MYEMTDIKIDLDTSLPESFDDGLLDVTEHKFTSEEFREKVMALQAVMPNLKDEDAPVTHHFAPGNYAREMLIPAGMAIIGKIHKHAHVNVISQGEIHVVTEFGTKRLKAPLTFISQPGTKRCVYAITDTVWTTIHPTDETDLEKIEEQVIAPNYELLLEGDVK